jgi:hypothetical protein
VRKRRKSLGDTSQDGTITRCQRWREAWGLGGSISCTGVDECCSSDHRSLASASMPHVPGRVVIQALAEIEEQSRARQEETSQAGSSHGRGRLCIQASQLPKVQTSTRESSAHSHHQRRSHHPLWEKTQRLPPPFKKQTRYCSESANFTLPRVSTMGERCEAILKLIEIMFIPRITHGSPHMEK